MWCYGREDKQSGMVLAVALLVLFLLSTLLITSFERSLLNLQLVNAFENKARVFVAAESVLDGWAAEIEGRSYEEPVFSDIIIQKSFQQEPIDECGRIFYHLVVNAHYQQAKVSLSKFFTIGLEKNASCTTEKPHFVWKEEA